MKLGHNDRASACWQRLRAHYAQRLAELRAKNDNASLNAEQTAILRGRILEVKLLLDLDNEDPAQPADGADQASFAA